MLLKDNSIFSSGAHFAEGNHLCFFSREEHSCELILNFGPVVQKKLIKEKRLQTPEEDRSQVI